MVAWVGGFHRGVIPRSWQGHLKVTAKSNQLKMVESRLLDQHFKKIGGNATNVLMVTSVVVWFHRGVIKAMQCNAIQVNARQCNEVVQCNVLQCNTNKCNAM